ncbi:MAG: hypothetical protein KGD65_10265 [Candidatus Lokiarchaeota archaeon]|nr:hypothetical protein [Candidatus Lokiarchaeota archaeon]
MEGIEIYPIFHVALPLILSEIPSIKKTFRSKILIIIGSILADLIDKPLLLLGLGPGRHLSHNLVFILISFLIVFVSTKKNLEISLSLLFGMVFHLILDLPEVPLFYPFVSYNFEILEEPLFYWINKFFIDPVVLFTEIMGIGILIYIFITNKLYHRLQLMKYLKGSSQSPIRIKK